VVCAQLCRVRARRNTARCAGAAGSKSRLRWARSHGARMMRWREEPSTAR
jgi:hypothetical protein